MVRHLLPPPSAFTAPFGLEIDNIPERVGSFTYCRDCGTSSRIPGGDNDDPPSSSAPPPPRPGPLMPGNWEGSTRGQRLPKDWTRTRRRILDRDGHQCTRVLEDGTRCRARATDVDHILSDSAGGSNDDTNLASLCAAHHKTKSSSEGTAARWRYRAQRPSTKHPGLA